MDFYNDQGAFLVKLLHDAPVPDFVKQSEYDTEESVNSLPDSAFASPTRRLYPIHTPSDVYLSAAYLHGKTATVDPDVALRIYQAAKVFDIEGDVKGVIDQAVEFRGRHNKVAAQEQRWEFSTKTATFAGYGTPHLNTAADELEKNFLNYSFAERTEIAENLQKLALEMGVEMPPSIAKFAGDDHVDLGVLETQLQARALALHDARDTREFLDKIAALRDAAEATPSEAMKVAEFLDGFDRQQELTKFYGSRLSDPHTAVFNTSRAEHEQKTAMVKIGNVNHHWYDLRKVDGDVFAEILGHKVADVKELANLNEEQARLINQVLA